MRSFARPSATGESDDAFEVAPLGGRPRRPGSRRSGARWRVVGLLALVLLAIVLTGAVFAFAQTLPPQIIFHHQATTRLPPYLFVWRHPAPGTLTPQQAYELEAQVWHNDDTNRTSSAPAVTLWVAQTNDAALALVLLAPGPLDDQHLGLVMLERTGGASGTWTGDEGPAVVAGTDCTQVDGYCVGIVEHTPTRQITLYGAWSKVGGASGTYVRFAEHLAGPAQGGSLEGTHFCAASSTPRDEPTAALVLIGASDQADVDVAATWLAAQP